MKPRTALYIGGAAVGATAVAMGFKVAKLRAAPAPSVPAAPALVHPAIPQRMAAPFALATGGAYAGAVYISAPLSWLATIAKVKDHAERQGFVHVVVSDKKPAGWPGAAEADYYVTGIYARPSQTLGAEHAGGAVKILEAFRMPRA